ncbi:MAG: uncharacterized protein K0Q72_3231, partial [Armatimonadetes bacterium]|nr:uncharacterized protein [Armatimonadota bacterium]
MLLALASLLACVALRREAAAPPAAATAYGNLPLAFEANEGQLPGEVRFASRADRRVVEVLEDGLRLRGTTGAALRFRMGAPAKPAAVRGQRPLAGRVHYLKGRDPRHWKRGIRTYGAVRRDAAYPGVDLVYYGRGQELEYDFIVAPGADPAAIRVAVQGTASASIDPSGDLVLADATGEVRQRRPIAYQERGGQREPVEVAYALQETAAPGAVEFGLQLGAYDRSLPLVVDPVLVYGTYFGGSGADLSLGGGIAVDAAGSAYVTGETASTDLPGATSPRPGGFRDAFVTKLNPAGTGAVYTTYVGGSDSDTARSIAVDAEGGVCITG